METIHSESKTILFMSADLSNSTVFKQASQSLDGRPGWLTPFETFFRELPLVLLGQMAQTFDDSLDIPEVGVWRVSGDEIVFLAEPRSANEGLRLTKAFYQTVFRYDRRLFERWPLRLRGCCWAARFPEYNIEIDIPEMATAGSWNDRVYHEYLGPDVDTGFRIAGHAESGHVIISLNLAEALARLPDQCGLRFHLVDRAVLKGVFDGRPYPLILITLIDEMPELWQWEVEESSQIRALRDEAPMKPEELIGLAENIRSYLNKVSRLNLAMLEF